MSSNINEVTESIGKKVVVITKNLDEIRKLLEQLKQPENNTNTTIQQERSIQEEIPLQESNLKNTEEDFIYDENYNSEFNTIQKGGKKRRSTMKRGKQNKKSQKKSKSHKKRH